MDYNFYLFSRLVHAIIIDSNAFAIPYDMEFEAIVTAYESYMRNADHDDERAEYEVICDWIRSDETLSATLCKLNTIG